MFFTLDLETRTLQNGNMEVISGIFYNGTDYFTYFISDYDYQSEKLIYAMITDLFKFAPKSISSNVYCHNFSNFDSIFLLKYLAEYSSTFSIVKRDDNLVKVNVSKKWSSEPKNVTKLVFLDSYLLLPEELAKLSQGRIKG